MTLTRTPRRSLNPNLLKLPTGTRLWRIHHRSVDSNGFNPNPSDTYFADGRFDPTTEDQYLSLHAALSPQGAVQQTLLHGAPYDADGFRAVLRAQVEDRRLSQIRICADLMLIDLRKATRLASTGADKDLRVKDPHTYPRTRHWVRRMRLNHPNVQGIVWQSPGMLTHDAHPGVAILFGDRCPDGMLQQCQDIIDLDDYNGAKWLNKILQPFNASIGLPSTKSKPATIVLTPPATKESPGQDSPTSVSSFEEFCSAYYRGIRQRVYAVTLDRRLADDATQEAFIVALRDWERIGIMYRPAAYVVTVAINIARRTRCKETAHLRLDPSKVSPDRRFKLNIPDHADGTVNSLVLEDALRAVPRDQAECFILHHFFGYKQREIAQQLDIPEGTVKSRINTARNALQDLLGRNDFEGGLR
jgi:RNA polymerase sigma factor (sigma-70 family)